MPDWGVPAFGVRIVWSNAYQAFVCTHSFKELNDSKIIRIPLLFQLTDNDSWCCFVHETSIQRTA